LFHTGRFVESLSTQSLVIFIIRTAGNPLRSRPSVALSATTLLVVGASIILPYYAARRALGLYGFSSELSPLFGGRDRNLPAVG
jgi:Mg2+-importing ATPase